jgi:DNA adenine methylase
MNLPPLVPPLKCQGIKTKLVGEIRKLVQEQRFERWIEPFCGSCVVPFNVQPKKALLSDSNVHIIRFYQDIQAGRLTPTIAKSFLTEEGYKLRTTGEDYFYIVRERFNNQPNSLDFLFLNRSCFNGVMRFNRHGRFNVPYCHIHLLTREHFYHVGSTENLRHPMIEALVMNFSIRTPLENKVDYEQMAFMEKPPQRN